MRYVIWLLLALATAVDAQRQQWQIGGAARVWSDSDSLQVLIDYDAAPGAIQPVYIDSSRSMLTLFAGWQPLKEPRELFYIEGETPRAWKGANGNVTTAHNGTYMVDGDSLTFNPPVSSNPESVWYTIDLAVPVPAHRFGFFTPPRGYRSDGTPFALDAVPAYEVSIAAEGDPAWLEGTQPYQRIGPVIADVPENFAANVQIEFPRQYVRFVRYKRKTSLLDSAEGSTNSVRSGTAFRGSIGDFELFGAGAPRKAIYRSQIFDLGMSVNFGRLRWAATPLRRVGDQWVEAPDAEVGVEVEVRTGRDGDPNVYHEYTDRGGEQVVSREHYDLVLQPRWRAGLLREPRPGMRASIIYDSENWSFWSLPFTQSGQTIDLRGGTHLQLRIVLKSEEFDALVRLDSLWIETAPLLASRVVGEVALVDDAQPAGVWPRCSWEQGRSSPTISAANSPGWARVLTRCGSVPVRAPSSRGWKWTVGRSRRWRWSRARRNCRWCCPSGLSQVAPRVRGSSSQLMCSRWPGLSPVKYTTTGPMSCRSRLSRAMSAPH